MRGRLGSRCIIFLALTAAIAAPAASPCRAAESERKVARVGFVMPNAPDTTLHGTNAFKERLRELGYVEGENLIVETRWAQNRYEQLPALIGDVLARQVDVLVTAGTPSAIAARNATRTVPIVVALMGDPVHSGLASTLARPGGNLTGLSLGWDKAMAGKWLELLQETVPRLSHVALIGNPDNPLTRDLTKEVEAAAPGRSLKLLRIDVSKPGAIDGAFEQAARKAQAALIIPDPLIASQRAHVAALAAKYRLPVIYSLRDFVDAGGLMAYAPDIASLFRRTAEYVDKILKGANPGDLPVEQPTKFELVVNLKTAKALGITIPESILLRADEVIR